MADSFTLPAAYGFRRLGLEEIQARYDTLGTLVIWEPPGRQFAEGTTRPRKGQYRYIMGVDVGDGIGKDRSVVDVHRMGTLEEPEEQVAQFVADDLPPSAFAFVVDAIGRLYTDYDGYEALAAIEINNHGLSVQDTLQLHLGYTHFYRWEYLDAGDPKRRFTTRIGWSTTPATRPLLLDKLYTALTTIDPMTTATDLVVHSAILLAELADFQTEGALWEAEAARGAHDDCVLACAIAHTVAWRLQGGEQEPLNERRARRHQEQMARAGAAARQGLVGQRDWRNTGCTSAEAHEMVDPDEVAENLYDDRYSPAFLR